MSAVGPVVPAAPREPELPPAGSPEATRRSRVVSIVGVLLSALYLTNPGFGWVELIPDALPLVGNLDEVGASGILFYCVQRLRARRAG